MVMEDDELSDDEALIFNVEAEDQGKEKVELSVMSLAQIDQHALMKTRYVCTIKLRGQVQEVPLLMLVDSEGYSQFHIH